MIMAGRKKVYDKSKLYSFRLDSEVMSLLSKTYHVNVNAQVNHYLSNLLTALILSEGSKDCLSHYVYTK